MLIYKGAYGGFLAWSLLQADGVTPYDLTGTEVNFRLWKQSAPGTALIDAAAIIDADPTTGRVQYAIVAGDFDTPGEYFGQFVAIVDGVSVVHFAPFLIQVKNVPVPVTEGE